jgi:formate dehydrogenase subunit delta
MDNHSRVVQMANDIGNFFRAQPNREDAISGIADHIKSFWTVRMQQKLMAHMAEDPSELDELPREAVRLLMSNQPLPETHSIGGDAG